MALPPLIAEIVRRLKARWQAEFGAAILEVRVFGSMARGDSHEESDLDIFVMVEERTYALTTALRNAAWDIGYEMEIPFHIQVVVMGREQFAELQRTERRIARDILTEGIAI